MIGGSSGGGEVWRSADGVQWEAATLTAGFAAREGHQAVAFGGSLWVVGGDGEGLLNDVWRSADGESWVSVSVAGGVFSKRENHRLVVHRVPLPFVFEEAEIVVSRPAVRTVAVTPVTLLTLRATGGVGALRFAMAGDDAGVATVGADSGAVVVTSLLAGGRATVSILVTDATPVNRMTVAVTMAFVGSLGFVTDSARLVVSPDFAGALYTLTATGGVGDYRYSRVAGPAAVTVDVASGVVSVTAGLASGERVAVFAVTDEGEGVARFTLGLQVDGSGAFASGYRDVMFVVGGYGPAYENDVWRSADGETWVAVSVVGDVFSGRQNHQVVAHGGSLWVIGGWDGRQFGNDVWRSADGISWVSVTVTGDVFSKRRYHQAFAHEGSLWVIGGVDGDGYENDVWRSADGTGWELVAASSDVFSGRVYHRAVSYRGSIWVIGGHDGRFRNDVWRSADGVQWELVTGGGKRFSGRYAHDAVVYRGRLWVIGGLGKGLVEMNDVWRSDDGARWVSVSVAVEGGVFSGRYNHEAVAYDDSLWVIGGVG